VQAATYGKLLGSGLQLRLVGPEPSSNLLSGANPRIHDDAASGTDHGTFGKEPLTRTFRVRRTRWSIRSSDDDTIDLESVQPRAHSLRHVVELCGQVVHVAGERLTCFHGRRAARVVQGNESGSRTTTRRYVNRDSHNPHARKRSVGSMPPMMIASRYLVRRPLGVGASGEVYEVLDTHEQAVVALKLLTSVNPAGPWIEAQILRRLSDSHILPIRNADVDVASGVPYIVTELATHGTIEGLVAAHGPRGLEINDVVRWTRHACYGVTRAHDLQLLHNDIKPGNLFLNAEGEVLVGDFGFATVIPAGARATHVIGATPETLAPEVAANVATPTATAASDVYSLGATARWMLTGQPALDFSGASDLAARLAIAATHVPKRLRDIAPHVPRTVADPIERAMARSPGDRFESPAALAEALGHRAAVQRLWSRTDEHPAHLACWRGNPAHGGSTLVLCLEQGAKASEGIITTQHAASGRKVVAGCRTTPIRSWGRAVRSVMRAVM
jgi:hypothetical protein